MDSLEGEFSWLGGGKEVMVGEGSDGGGRE